MRADVLAAAIIFLYLLAYKIYSKFLAEKVFCLNNKNKTPAHELEDGMDFVPTRKHILFGHHFSSIAGAAPIVGPCIAIYWGWLPALIWLVAGNIIMGAVHDMGTLLLSVRHKAESIGSIAGSVINKRTKLLFLIVILFLIWIVAAAFTVVIARLFVSYPASVIPVNIAIVLALIIGYVFYQLKWKPLIPSVIALVLLYASIPLGLKFPIDLSLSFGLAEEQAIAAWSVFLILYGFIASVLPVWLLLQPRDYINSHQLIVGLVILLLGIFVSQPTIVAPAMNLNPGDGPPWFPFLFMTLACGAISGAHGLVASGTTSKQLNKETDIRPIGYGSMLMEGTVGLLALVAATAGFADSEAWNKHYFSWEHASKHGLSAFVDGAANFIANLGVAHELGAIFVAVIVITFAATTLDTTFRIQRFILSEIGEMISEHIRPKAKARSKSGFRLNLVDSIINVCHNRYLTTGFGVFTVFALMFSDGFDNLNGAFKLWPLFGSTNQLVASISLLIISVYLFKFHLKKKGKQSNKFLFTAIPAIGLVALTLFSGIMATQSFHNDNNHLLSSVSCILFILQAWITIEGLLCFRKIKS